MKIGLFANLAKVDLLYWTHARAIVLSRGLFEIVEMNMKKPEMRVGDLVRIRRSSGLLSDQRYKVEKIGPRFYCEISQWPSDHPKPAHEPFDTDLLVVDNAGPKMLANLFGRR